MHNKINLALSFVIASLMSGCGSSERIDNTVKKVNSDYDTAVSLMNKTRSLNNVVQEASSQWINTTPIFSAKKNNNIPGCSITINRSSGSIRLAEIAERVSQVCHMPVTITPDAMAMLHGSSGAATQQMNGAIPSPSSSSTGMVPLANINANAPQSGFTTANGDVLDGFVWSGSLAGMLDTVSSRLGISWRYEHGRIYFFYLETKSFPIAFMDSKTTFNAKVVSGTTSKAGSGGDGQSGNAISGDANTSQSTTMDIKSSLYADLQNSIKSMLTPGIGRVFLSAGNVTVTDSPQVLESVSSFIEDRNRELNRQVVLNVEVLSVQKNSKDQIGIDWNAIFKSGSLGLSLANSFNGASELAMTGGMSLIDGHLAGSKAFIKALSQQANVSVVTQQSSTTTNLNPVPMQVAEQEDYVSQVTTETTANVGSTTSITPATITTGFNMTLLPYIMPDAQHLQLQFSISLSDEPTRRTFESGKSKVELLNTKLKTVNQRINLKSGQTIVLSGFQQADNKTDKQGVGQPWFFGLGGGQSSDNDNTMLVILITPTILL